MKVTNQKLTPTTSGLPTFRTRATIDPMGVSRYSRDHVRRRWEERFDDLQHRCHWYDFSPTIGELIDHGIHQAKWRCRNGGWKPDGKGECWHSSKPFDLTRFGPKLPVHKLRWKFVCSECGRNRPFIELLAD